MRAKFLPSGDGGITVNFGNEISEKINAEVTAFTAAFEAA